MILRVIVCVVMVVFCLWQGIEAANVPSESGRHYFPIVYIICPVLLLGGLNPMGLITWPIASILLLLRGHWVAGWVPAAFVVFTLAGNRVLQRKGNPGLGGNATEDVVANFVRYCKAYLSDRCSLTPEQAQILVLDPDLGMEMDAAKREWAWRDLPPEADPDTFLLARDYDAPEMKRINSVLDRYAKGQER